MIHVNTDPADPGLGLPGHMIARTSEGLDSVEIRLRWDGRTGTRKALLMLARAAIEVCVAAREISPVLPPSREAEGSRWHG